jgi:hypothetical protein
MRQSLSRILDSTRATGDGTGRINQVLAAEELIASKLFIARWERFDGADIAHVIYGTQGKLDWQRILRMAGEH